MTTNQKNELMQRGMQSDVILSDFFNTIVYRDISDDVLLNIWAKRLSASLNFCVSAKSLIKERHIAARILFRSNKDIKEIKYEDLISELSRILYKKHNIQKDNLFTISLQIEDEINLEHLFVNQELVEVYRALNSEGKRIYIVSDYILSKQTISKYIQCLNIDALFEDIFVSCDCGGRKVDGSLYWFVKKEIGQENSFLMIGDNINSDYHMALKCNINAFHIQSDNINRKVVYDIEGELKSLAFAKETFSNYGFGLYIFIDRLYQALIKDNHSSLLFFSREGYDFVQLFEMYQARKPRRIDCKYIYVSRKSTLLAAIYDGKNFDFSPIKNANNTLSVNDFLRNLSIDANQLNSCIYNLIKDFNLEVPIECFFESDVFNTLLHSSEFVNDLIHRCLEEKQKIKKYLSQNIDISKKRIAVCDVGWKGTIQDNLYCGLDREVSIWGYYFGLESLTGKENSDNIKNGIVFTCYPTRSKYYKYTNFETHLLEQILCAPHGSALGYEYIDNQVVPKLAEPSDADVCIYNFAKRIKPNVFATFETLCNIFDVSAEDSYSMDKQLYRYFVKGQLTLNKEAIEFEKISLNSKTNNFGHFTSEISRKKKSLLSYFFSIIKAQIQIKGGLIQHLNYFAVKMNSRGEYKWKINIYIILYFILDCKNKIIRRW